MGAITATQITPLSLTHVEREQEVLSNRGCEGCVAHDLVKDGRWLIKNNAKRVEDYAPDLERADDLIDMGLSLCREFRESKPGHLGHTEGSACQTLNPPPASEYHFHLDPEATRLFLKQQSTSQSFPIVDSEPRRLR